MQESQRRHALANPVVTVARLLAGSPANDGEVASRRATLADLAPGLRQLEARVTDGEWRADAGDPDLGLDAYVSQGVDDVVRSSDSSATPVVSSIVARTIATSYLMIISGVQAVGDVDSPLLSSDEVPI